MPIAVGGSVSGALLIETTRAPRTWKPEARQRIDLAAAVFGQVLMRQHDATTRPLAAGVAVFGCGVLAAYLLLVRRAHAPRAGEVR